MNSIHAYQLLKARTDDQFTFFWSPHGKGLAQLLRMRGFPRGYNRFENDLFGVLSGTLILQSLANPEIKLTSQEYFRLEEALAGASESVGALTSDQHWRYISRISRLMSEYRDAVATGLPLDAIMIEADQLQQSMDTLLGHLRSDLETTDTESHTPIMARILYALRQRILGSAMATQAILLCVRRTLFPQKSTLDTEGMNLCREALILTDAARSTRPVGAIWTVHLLTCTWCAVRDVDLRAKIEEAIIDYQRDAMSPTFQIQRDKLRLLEQRLSLRQ